MNKLIIFLNCITFATLKFHILNLLIILNNQNLQQ